MLDMYKANEAVVRSAVRVTDRFKVEGVTSGTSSEPLFVCCAD